MTERFCMTCEEPELFTVICDFSALFYMILRCKSSEWLEWPIKSDFGISFAIWSNNGALTFVMLPSFNTLSSVRIGH